PPSGSSPPLSSSVGSDALANISDSFLYGGQDFNAIDLSAEGYPSKILGARNGTPIASPPQPPSAAALLNEGSRLLEQNRYPEALEKVDQAILIYQRDGETRELAACLGVQSSILDKLKRHDESLQLAQRAMKVAKDSSETADDLLIAECCN